MVTAVPATPTVPSDFFQARQDRKAREVELWRQWKSTNDPIVLEQLFESLRPLMKRISQGYAGSLPQPLIEAKVKKWGMKALETYNPNAGTALATHVQNYSQKVLRDVARYQNLGRLPEATAFKMPSYLNLKVNMQEALGREPTYGEIADELKTTIAEVKRLESGSRKDLMAIEGNWLRPQNTQEKEQEITEHIFYELSPEEQFVLEHTLGVHGKPALTSTQISQRMHVSVTRVNQMKHRIADVVKRFYGSK